MTNVFVYGTLRKGRGNYGLLERSIFVGSAVTVRKYAMYVSGIPYVTELERETTIVGEVYEVDEFTLDRLDQLEGHPDFYERRKIKVFLEDGRKIKAFLYFCDRVVQNGGFDLDKVVNGDFVNPDILLPENVIDQIWWTDLKH